MSALNPASTTLSPLPFVLSHGLVAVSTFGLLSFFCSTSLFFYLTYRLVYWRRHSHSKAPTNQFLFLIYNLLLADIQQSIAFLLNIGSLRRNALVVGIPECWAQGWFVSTGDLASGVFICAIAIHTFLSVVKEYRLSSAAFYSCIASLWTFVYLMAAIGPLIHRENFYVRAGAWCWVNDDLQNLRLWLHYFWIFVCMFSTILIYTFIIIYLHRRSHTLPLSSSQRNTHHGVTPLMILYPLIYTICTIPLAAGRIASMAGRDISLSYFCVAGSMIACNGWLDVLLYASTRADIVFSELPPGEETGLETFVFMGKGHELGTVTTIHGGGTKRGSNGGGSGGTGGNGRVRKSTSASTEHLYGLGSIVLRER
jgi:hypothetical protein